MLLAWVSIYLFWIEKWILKISHSGTKIHPSRTSCLVLWAASAPLSPFFLSSQFHFLCCSPSLCSPPLSSAWSLCVPLCSHIQTLNLRPNWAVGRSLVCLSCPELLAVRKAPVDGTASWRVVVVVVTDLCVYSRGSNDSVTERVCLGCFQIKWPLKTRHSGLREALLSNLENSSVCKVACRHIPPMLGSASIFLVASDYAHQPPSLASQVSSKSQLCPPCQISVGVGNMNSF